MKREKWKCGPVLGRVLQRTELIKCVYVVKEVYFKELARAILETWQVQNLMGAAGRVENQKTVAVWVHRFF